MTIIGEDSLCCALAERMVDALLPKWEISGSVDTCGVTKLVASLPRYFGFARHQFVLCVADTDGQCPKELLDRWQVANAPQQFLLRLAVQEAESWALADREAFADYFKVVLNKIPFQVDDLGDPKRHVLNLVARSSVRRFREEMISKVDTARPGVGYNLHLQGFVRQAWRCIDAQVHSVSLQRAGKQLLQLACS
ncbi:MAG: DUF4276 family protein [Xanthomonadales bacterium]|nr:DUF4276 family protein [Xanthomonadales bacterium]